ncbi:MAG: hypothetical protein QHH14_00105 [Clostridiales bacterium]|nr:hypothetical protein [Clostridiales bacterium]
MKRKFLSLFLLFCVTVDPLVGTFTWLHYKKTIVKKEAKRIIEAGVDDDSLVVLKFSKEEAQTKLRWEHPQEFEYNHKMYDVVKTMICDGTIYYWCRQDDEETTLNMKLEELASKALGESAKSMANLTLLISCFKSLYCTFSFRWSVPEPRLLGEQLCLFHLLYPRVYIRPPTPPPRFN